MEGPLTVDQRSPDSSRPEDRSVGTGPQRERLSSYFQRLLDAIMVASRSRGATFESVAAAARGAFPLEVARCLAETRRTDLLGLDNGWIDRPAPERPELHPLDFEWYFAPDAIRVLAEQMPVSGSLLGLGTPTLAAHLAVRGRAVTLVDRSPMLGCRFNLSQGDWTLLRSDLRSRPALRRGFSAVVIDPPWYVDTTLLWLTHARELVKPSGRIVLSLFPELTRPSAVAERDNILDVAESIGRVRVHNGAITYQTPAFEQRLLRRGGVPNPGNWRRGDLVTIEVGSPSVNPLPVAPIGTEPVNWRTFTLGDQVIKLRARPSVSRRGTVLAPLGEDGSWYLPSVSRRDPRRGEIDLWTSRNRVARVQSRGSLDLWLEHLCRPRQSPISSLNELRQSVTDEGDQLERVAELLEIA